MKISVIVPAYNIKEYINYSIESVLRQKAGCDYEVIVVDDGSTDGTSEECDKYISTTNVKIIHKFNGGLSSARNTGINIANGDYVMFLDGDDYLEDGAFNYLVSIIDKYPYQIDFIQYRYDEVTNYDSYKRMTWDNCSEEVITDRYEAFCRKISLGGIGASACTKLIRREIFEKLRFKEGIIHEDEFFTSHLINNTDNNIIYTNATLYHYVKREGSIIQSEFNRKKLDVIPVQKEQITILESNGYADLSSIVRSRLFVYLCLLYELARKSNDEVSSNQIKIELQQMVKFPMQIKGKFGLMALAIKLHLPVLQCYYLYKKMLCPK